MATAALAAPSNRARLSSSSWIWSTLAEPFSATASPRNGQPPRQPGTTPHPRPGHVPSLTVSPDSRPTRQTGRWCPPRAGEVALRFPGQGRAPAEGRACRTLRRATGPAGRPEPWRRGHMPSGCDARYRGGVRVRRLRRCAVNDLVIEDLKAGDGVEAKAGDTISAHYVGVAHSTGEEFDASWNRGAPMDFRLGVGQVIKGWDDGIVGMKVGGRRKLTIPANLAYGDRGAGGAIKPGETLIFVVDLVDAR